jgi:hypothetical protein
MRSGPAAPLTGRARAAARAACEGMAAYFPDFHDAQLRLPAYWADCELRLAGDAAAARAVWEAALKSASGRRGRLLPFPACHVR